MGSSLMYCNKKEIDLSFFFAKNKQIAVEFQLLLCLSRRITFNLNYILLIFHILFIGGSNFNTMSSTHGSVSSPQGFNTLGSNQSPQGFNTLGSNQLYRTESHDKYHTMGSTGSQDRFGTMGSQPETSRFTTLGSQQDRFGTMGSQQDRFGTAGSQNFSTMSSGHQQQFGTMGSQQNGGTLHVDTRQGNMHSGPSSAGR